MSQKQHIKAEEKSIPQHGNEFYTHSDPHFKDHTIPEDFTKNTGIDIKDIPAFGIKELQDNGADFYERHNNNSSTYWKEDKMITAGIYNVPSGLTIYVSNNNPKGIQFPPLRKVYDYGHSYSSNSQTGQANAWSSG